MKNKKYTIAVVIASQAMAGYYNPTPELDGEKVMAFDSKPFLQAERNKQRIKELLKGFGLAEDWSPARLELPKIESFGQIETWSTLRRNAFNATVVVEGGAHEDFFKRREELWGLFQPMKMVLCKRKNGATAWVAPELSTLVAA